MHSLSSSEVWLCEASSSLLFDLLPLPNISFDTASSFFFFSKLFIFPLKAISILVEASQWIFQTLLLNQHKSVAFGYFLLTFSLHFHDLCAPHPRLCILAVIPPTSVTTISISWAAVSELQGPTFSFLLGCEDLQEAQLAPFLPPPLFCAKLLLVKSSIFLCPTSKSVSMFLILKATHPLSKLRLLLQRKNYVAAIFSPKLIIVGQSNTPHTDSVSHLNPRCQTGRRNTPHAVLCSSVMKLSSCPSTHMTWGSQLQTRSHANARTQSPFDLMTKDGNKLSSGSPDSIIVASCKVHHYFHGECSTYRRATINY